MSLEHPKQKYPFRPLGASEIWIGLPVTLLAQVFCTWTGSCRSIVDSVDECNWRLTVFQRLCLNPLRQVYPA